jgi:nitrile hydratase subunit alpha
MARIPQFVDKVTVKMHTEDSGAHIRAVFEDAEYWRTKRLEPIIFQLIRKGKLGFFDFVEAPRAPGIAPALLSSNSEENIADRIETLELNLGKYINGIEIAAQVAREGYFIEEQRTESGIYDPERKFIHREFPKEVELMGQLSSVERMLGEYYEVLQAYLRALVSRNFIREDKLKEMVEAPVPPKFENGAKIVARAWIDREFKEKLLQDAKATLREIGIAVYRSPKVVALENTKDIHNVIVCTLCSCYPYAVLGNPPWWYKDDAYKQAIVANPRKTLQDMFQYSVPDKVELAVYDSTSDIRYFVLPQRPAGTERIPEEELWKLVTPESLIGVGEPRSWVDAERA